MRIPRLSCQIYRRYCMLAHARTLCCKTAASAVKCHSCVRLNNVQLFHTQFVSSNGCKLVTVADESAISRRLCEMCTADELLNYVGDVDSERWTPELSSLLTERLVSTHHQSLCSTHPWLQENVVAANKQLRLAHPLVLQEAMSAIHLHPAYETWMNIVEHTCSGYSPDQLAGALLSTLNLFVDPQSSLVHRLLSEVHRQLPFFGFAALASLSSSLKLLPGNNDIFVRLMMKRAQTLLSTVKSVNASELLEITTIFSNLRRFLSADVKYRLVAWLLHMIKNNKEVLLTPTCAGALFRLGQIQSFKNYQKLVNIVVEACEEYADKFTVSDVVKMSILLQNFYGLIHNRHHVMSALESRALCLLSDDSRLSEVVGLMWSLTRFSPQQIILQYYSALHMRLICCDYVDAFTVINIAKILGKMPTVNTDLLALVQNFLVDHAETVVLHPVMFSWIEGFLVHHRFANKNLEKQFNDHLLSYVRNYIGVYPRYAKSVVSTYLLPLSDNGLPHPVFKSVISSVPQWRESTLLKNSWRFGSLQRSLPSNHQLQQLDTVLYQTLCNQLDLVDSLDCLHTVACSLLMHRCQRHPVVTDRVMNMFQRFSSELSDNCSAVRISSLFSRLCYYSPPIYDDLVRYVMTKADANTELLIALVSFACAKVGYVPIGAEELLQMAGRAYHKLIANRNYYVALKLLYSLTSLQLFLDNEVSKLFTLDSLEQLDLYMADNRDKRQLASSIEDFVLFLNRAVVLDCPHLDVPWFREKASKVFLKRGMCKSRCSATIVNEVKDLLSEVLGGLNYLRISAHSQYYYHLDFECVLDGRQQPVDVSRWSHVERMENSQKIAVCVLGKNSYCYNSQRLTGFVASKKRHLEIMNYKFVEIPYFDWYSMALSDEKEKLDYIEKKLLR